MAFFTKVRKTGQLFQATTDLGMDGAQCHVAALPIESDRTYMGHLFVDGIVSDGRQIVRCTKVKTAFVEGSELEWVSIERVRICQPAIAEEL